MSTTTSSQPDKRAIEAIAEPVCRAHGVELVDVQWTMDRGGPVLRVLIDRERPDARVVEGPVVEGSIVAAPAVAAPAVGARAHQSTAGAGPGSGVTIDDCQAVSRDLSTALDVHERVVPTGRYRLEVSSPGLDRPLTRRRDYERFAGREIKVQTRVPMPGTADRKKVQGVLVGLDGDVVWIEEGSTKWEVPFADIVKANLVYRF